MAQYDVHANPGRNRQSYPYFVIVQSARFDAARSRLVVPLSPVRGAVELSPVFRIEGREVALVPLQMFAIPREALGALVASLADDQSRIQISNALDEVLTTAFG